MKRERKPLRPGKGKWLNFIYGILRLSVFLVLIAQFSVSYTHLTLPTICSV